MGVLLLALVASADMTTGIFALYLRNNNDYKTLKKIILGDHM